MAEIVKKVATLGKVRSAQLSVRNYGLLGALVATVLFFQWRTHGRLLYPQNVNNLIGQNAYVVVLAIGMVMVIIAGHIDLSVGSVAAMIGAIVGLAIKDWGLPWPVAVLIALLVGALVGAWQGFWVAFVGIPAFIVTLAGMLLFRGLTLVFLTGGTIGGLPEGFVAISSRWVPGFMGGFDTPRFMEFLGKVDHPRDTLTIVIGAIAVVGMVVGQMRAQGKLKARGLPRTPLVIFVARNVIAGAAIMYFAWLLAGHKGLPYVLIILSILVIAYTFVLNRTVFGRHIYAMGGNRFAAIMSGVRTKWVDFYIFVNIGVLTALAGVITTARSAGAVASAGTNFELDAIAAVFIGGAAVQGGVGKISGAVIGATIMGVLNQGLSIMGIDPAWQQVIKGLVLLAAVAFDIVNRRRAGDR